MPTQSPISQHRIIFCGDREWRDYDRIKTVMIALRSNFGYFTVIEGEANGADSLSRLAAVELGLTYLAYPACWDKYGKCAGPIRNEQMVSEGKATAVVAFHNNLTKSKGTKHMVGYARKLGLPVWVSSDGNGALFNFIHELKQSERVPTPC